MRVLGPLAALLLLCAAPVAAAAEDEDDEGQPAGASSYSLKGAKIFHRNFIAGGEEVDARAPDEHLLYMLEDAEKSLGAEPSIFLLSARKFKNAMAFIHVNNARGILVDEDEFDVREDEPAERHKRNYTLAALSLAHEIGHHFCKHVASGWEEELQADQIAGWILAKSSWAQEFYDLTLDEVIAVGSGGPLGDAQGSATHPPLAKRIAALRAGWGGEPVCGAR